MPDECLICSAPLEYLETETDMTCTLCGRSFPSRSRCVKGHYVCDECHTRGIGAIFGLCLRETSRDPIAIMDRLMALPFCHMHGPEHHIMVGAALLTAYRNAGGQIDLEKSLREIRSRGSQVPGGACGFWGACGAGLSTGQFLSIVTGATPLATESFSLAHRMTARSLQAIGEVGGPRCCKRDSYLSILQAIDFVSEHLGVQMDRRIPLCHHAARNAQCIGRRCPFSPANADRKA